MGYPNSEEDIQDTDCRPETYCCGGSVTYCDQPDWFYQACVEACQNVWRPHQEIELPKAEDVKRVIPIPVRDETGITIPKAQNVGKNLPHF